MTTTYITRMVKIRKASDRSKGTDVRATRFHTFPEDFKNRFWKNITDLIQLTMCCASSLKSASL